MVFSLTAAKKEKKNEREKQKEVKKGMLQGDIGVGNENDDGVVYGLVIFLSFVEHRQGSSLVLTERYQMRYEQTGVA